MDNELAYATVRLRVWRGHLYLCVRDLPRMRQISSHHASTQGGSFVGCVIIWRLKHIQVEFLFFSDLGVRGVGVSSNRSRCGSGDEPALLLHDPRLLSGIS